jgi:hypothetical protein
MSATAPFFSSERDGFQWLYDLEHNQEYYEKWKRNLAIAEITGFYTYCAVVKALQNPLPRWAGCDLSSYIHHANIIAKQEQAHYNIVSARLEIEVLPVDHEGTFAELDVNERRSEMRLSTIITNSSNKDLVTLANRLMIDEAYHCWYTRLVLRELGDFPLPRLQ